MTMGRKATQAKYFLNDSDAVMHLLDTLQNVSAKSKRNKSYNELRNDPMTPGVSHQHIRNNSGSLLDSTGQQDLILRRADTDIRVINTLRIPVSL